MKDLEINSRRCKFCDEPLKVKFIDLGMQPLCQKHVKPKELDIAEEFYHLHAYVCENCYLVQLGTFAPPEKHFTEYAYFSSFSKTWLNHAKEYTIDVCRRFNISKNSFVVEIGSNDGYLLQYFKEREVAILGIEPAKNVATHALNKGIPTISEFFSENTAKKLLTKYRKPNLIIGNNVLAHVPEINDFIRGIRTLLATGGIITMEFPHLLQLVKLHEFDTIYHEHYFYYSLRTVIELFKYHQLKVFSVDKLKTHGGSLRIYACHALDISKTIDKKISKLLLEEEQFGLYDIDFYRKFQIVVESIKFELLNCFIKLRKKGKHIAAYGAPGKGSVLLNYCGIRTDIVEFTVDRNPYKQNNYMPGVLIPIYSEKKILELKPDYIFILPWNLKEEIMKQLYYVKDWNCKFIVPIPKLKIYSSSDMAHHEMSSQH